MKIIVPKEISERIYKQVDKNGVNETKGALFAEQTGNEEFLIEDVYMSKTKGNTVFSNLINNCAYKRFEKKYFKKHSFDYEKHNYIGDWHSHPLYECVPSNFDKKELMEELSKSNAIFLIQVILKIENKQLIGKCYFCNKNSTYKECTLIIEQ